MPVIDRRKRKRRTSARLGRDGVWRVPVMVYLSREQEKLALAWIGKIGRTRDGKICNSLKSVCEEFLERGLTTP